MKSAEAMIVDKIREWLDEGATIKATIAGSPLIEIRGENTVFMGLSVSYPKNNEQRKYKEITLYAH